MVSTPFAEHEARKLDELRMLYSACVSEIASFKQHQWQVTNYGLLLYAAAVSLHKLIGRLTTLEYVCLYVFLVLICGMGWFVVGLFAQSIQLRRKRLTEIRRHFTSEFREAWRGGEPEASAPDNPDQKLNLLWMFRSLFVVGLIAALWLVATSQTSTSR